LPLLYRTLLIKQEKKKNGLYFEVYFCNSKTTHPPHIRTLQNCSSFFPFYPPSSILVIAYLDRSPAHIIRIDGLSVYNNLRRKFSNSFFFSFSRSFHRILVSERDSSFLQSFSFSHSGILIPPIVGNHCKVLILTTLH
jgi:hypothetical protein